ncbi:RluA family pseudouridine synthase [Mariniblastus fucicola]|uniref:Pseudouridine synthase n=1 Tax=Mariniblastus fucicola TaxID=980251 RepID=A0A5B9PDP7_9BACT|nr:RluA family pseudouridine synthase [Mariniblastus fucicola]QEG22696.1 Pseudouridine synthase [Mariniblastus fucicola]
MEIEPEREPNLARTIVVAPEEDQQRLDSFLVSHFSKHSRVRLQRAIAKGDVLVDGKKAKSSTKLKPGQSVVCEPIEAPTEGPIPEDIPLDLIFEDEHMIAINKPPLMVVHPAKGHWSGTLTAALAFHFKSLSSIGGPTRPGIVHRLDRDTSGVILVAKTDQAHAALGKQFQDRTVEKEYHAIVTPAPDRDRDVIDKPIGNHPYQREKKAIRENHSSSRAAVSMYEVLERLNGFALVAVKPKTGRTHQIRVHMAHVGCPVACDRLYSGRARLTGNDLNRDGDETVLLDRQALHARKIGFDHPVSGERMLLESKFPADMTRLWEAIKTRKMD